MSEFLDILDNHRELLQERGYDEIGLGSADEPGLFLKKLEYLFSECLRKSEYNNEKQGFLIEAFGFFDNDKDLVQFNFHYEFDPSKKDINLKSFSASMSGIKRTFLIGPNMYHLIHANRVHKTLCNERALQESGELTIPQINIDKMVYEQDKYLEQIGYYKTLFTNPPKFIRHELKSELEKLIGQPAAEIQHIEINRYLHFQPYDSTEFSFHYLYDPVKSKLHLESITAKTDEVEKTFQIERGKVSVTLQEMYDTIKDAERVEKAKQIAMLTPPKMKRQKL